MNADVIFRDTVAKLLAQRLNVADSTWLVAVSGGIDSMVLLDVSRRVRDKWGGMCIAAHIHHGLRSASDDEEAFIRHQCQEWGIPVEVRKLELSAYLSAHSGVNLEKTARERRYSALRDIAQARSASCVWLGHHADDQLETMLWRIARGTSQSGLSGMKVRWTQGGLTLFRPLLSHARRTIETYSKMYQIPYLEDETNRSTRFTRNHIRHRVVPELRHGHPRVAEHAAHLASILQDEDEWMDEQARAVLHQIGHRANGTFHIDVSAFCRQPLPLQRRAIKILLYCLAAEEWTTRHIEAVVQLAHSESPSSSVRLAGSITAWREYGSLQIGRRLAPTVSLQGRRSLWMLSPGSERTGIRDAAADWRFHCSEWNGNGERSPSLWEARFFSLDEVVVRASEPGERVAPIGMIGTKKVQDVFTDAKVPKHVRWSWPVLADASGTIVWIPGILRTRYYLLSSGDLSGWVIRAERHPQDQTSG